MAHIIYPWTKTLTFFMVCSLQQPIVAQIIPDNTLGLESSVVSPINIIRQEISGGALRDGNLFHSFQEFGIPSLQEAYFQNPVTVENIFTRVTGSNESSINGTLGVYGNANLFLINPNGITFGKHAILDISGSFLASTAQEIFIENSCVDLQTAPQSE